MATYEKRRDGYRVRWKELEVVRLEGGGTSRAWRDRNRQVPDLETAKALCREIERVTALGQRWTPELERPRSTLQSIFAAYMDAHMHLWTPRTAMQYARKLDTFLEFAAPSSGQLFGDVLSRELLTSFFDDQVNGQVIAGRSKLDRKRKPQTARQGVEVIQLAWAWAADSDDFSADVPRPRTIEMPKGTKTPTIAPSWGEMDRCIAAVDGWCQKLAIVLRYTGLRPLQAMHLKRSDLDSDRNTLTIPGELGKSEHEQEGRIVAVTPHLAAAVAEWNDDGEWLVPSERADVRSDVIRTRGLLRAWRRTGVPADRWKAQPAKAFRKGFTSGLKRLGADLEAVEYATGHARPSVRGAYLDPDYLPNRELADLVPAIGADTGEPLRLVG